MNRSNALNDTNQTEQITHSQADPIRNALCQLAEASKPSDKQSTLEDLDLTRVIATTLLQIQRTLSELDARISQLQGPLERSAARKEWYSIGEVAEQLGKAEFTVREWCRFNRITARKRECGRGGKREWMISEKELERIRNKGLLPANL